MIFLWFFEQRFQNHQKALECGVDSIPNSHRVRKFRLARNFEFVLQIECGGWPNWKISQNCSFWKNCSFLGKRQYSCKTAVFLMILVDWKHHYDWDIVYDERRPELSRKIIISFWSQKRQTHSTSIQKSSAMWANEKLQFSWQKLQFFGSHIFPKKLQFFEIRDEHGFEQRLRKHQEISWCRASSILG